MSKWSEKIPSFVWVLIIVAGLALFIGAMWGGFYAVTHLEGFGSIVLLAAAWGALRLGANSPDLEDSSVGVAIVIVFFAMMGVGLDQPGNFIYNRPMEWIFCAGDAELVRAVSSRAARGGGVAVSQNFSCISETGEIISRLDDWKLFAYRFLQYVALGYLLLGASRLYTRIKTMFGRRKNAERAG